jgi:Cu+-exporting ATPase
MTVDPARAAGQFEHQGTTYYFCGKGCLEKFNADPARFVAPAAGGPESAGGPKGPPLRTVIQHVLVYVVLVYVEAGL